MSTLTRCENGHFYDSEKYRNCPYCAIQTGSVGDTVPVQKLDLSFRSGQQKQPDDIGETVGYYDAMPVKPVVGWLVAVEGASQGRDFRLCSGRNYIGRSDDMDIQLKNDPMVSRNRHAIVVFDPISGRTLCQAGESRELYYLNDAVVTDAVELRQGDILTIGRSKLMFVPFCGALHSWEAQD